MLSTNTYGENLPNSVFCDVQPMGPNKSDSFTKMSGCVRGNIGFKQVKKN